MRAFEALHQLTERFAPMSEKSGIDLQNQSQQQYMRVLDEVEAIDKIKDNNAKIQQALEVPGITDAEKETLMAKVIVHSPEKLEHKIVRFAEKWWVRYLISALFVWIQPKIQNYLNPPPPQLEPDYED